MFHIPESTFLTDDHQRIRCRQQTLYKPMAIHSLDRRLREWLALRETIHDEQIQKWDAEFVSPPIAVLLCIRKLRNSIIRLEKEAPLMGGQLWW